MSKRCYQCGKIMRVLGQVVDALGRGARTRDTNLSRSCINPKCENSPYYKSPEEEEEE